MQRDEKQSQNEAHSIGHIWRGFGSSIVLTPVHDAFKVKKIALGHSHALILTEKGEVFGIGSNSEGQLGNTDLSEKYEEPCIISFFRDKCIKEVACGPHNSAAVLSTGEVYMWGNNENKQCGEGGKNIYIPERVHFEEFQEECIHGKLKLTNKTCIIQLSCGEAHTAALSDKHEVWMWGTGIALGLINTVTTSKPKRIDFLKDKKVLSVVCGHYHTLALISASSKKSKMDSNSESSSNDLCPWCMSHLLCKSSERNGQQNTVCPLGLRIQNQNDKSESFKKLDDFEKFDHIQKSEDVKENLNQNSANIISEIDISQQINNGKNHSYNKQSNIEELNNENGNDLDDKKTQDEAKTTVENSKQEIEENEKNSSVKIPAHSDFKSKFLRSMSESAVGTKILATARSVELGQNHKVKLRSHSESIDVSESVEEMKENGLLNEDQEGVKSPLEYQRQKSSSLIDAQSAKEYLAQRLSNLASAMSPSALTSSKEPVFLYEATTEALRQNVSTLTNMVVSGVTSGVVSGVKNTLDKFGFVSRQVNQDFKTDLETSSLEDDKLYENNDFEIIDADIEMSAYSSLHDSPQFPRKGFAARASSLKSEIRRKLSRSNRVGSLDASLNDGKDAGFMFCLPWKGSTDDAAAMLSTEVWTWGRGNMGQLGQGDGMDRLQPCCINLLRNQCIIKLEAGLYHSLALTAGGHVFAWGYNSHGQLGNPEYSVPCYTPTKIKLQENVDFRNTSKQLDSAALVWDIAAGCKHSVLLAEQGLQTGIYYCGKQEGPVPLSGSIGTNHPILVPITGNDFIVRQVFAGEFLCSCVADSASFLHLTAIRELAASERFFYQTLTLLRDTVLDPLIKDACYSSISSSPFGGSVQELLNTFKEVWEQVALNNHCLGTAIQRSPQNVNILPIIERVVKSNTWISAFERYATAFVDLLAINGLNFCAKTASLFLGKTQPFKQELGKNKNIEEKQAAEILARLLEEPIRRMGEYQRSFEMLAEHYKHMKFSNFRELDIAERWGQLANSYLFEKEMSEQTRSFWESCPQRLCDSLRIPKRRLLRDSKTSPVSIPGSGRFSTNWFLLFNDVLVHSQFSGQTVYDLALVWVDFLSDSETIQNAFTLTMPEDTLTLQCLSPQEKTEWIHSLNQAINCTLHKPTSSDETLSHLYFGFSGHHLSPPLTRTAMYTFTKHQQFKDATYTGTWVRSKLFGHGELSWPDGRKYTGKFKQNVQHGDGLFIAPSAEGNKICEGMWKDGKMNGLGSIRYPNGDLYEGYFKDGLCNGHGILKKGQFMSSAASIYIGEWANGRRCGYGVMDDIVNGEKYMGMWQDDNRHGNGMVVTLDGVYYEGNFVQNKMTGQGLMIFEDSSWYEGEFGGSGGFNGKGVLTMSGGDKIDGQFYGLWNEGIKVNGTIFKNSGPSVSSSNSPSSFAKLSVPADEKWKDIFFHCQELLGVNNTTEVETVNSQRLWETVAVIINDWKKKLQRDSTKTFARVADLDGLEKIPQCKKGKLTLEGYQEIKNYASKAFDSSFHPLGKLMEGLVDVYRATYVGVGAHPRLLTHAVEEIRSFIERIYKIVRLLFPDLPPVDQEYKVRPAAMSSPSSQNSDEEEEEMETEVVTASGLILPILLPRIYPPLFTLYALHNEKDDNKYWETLLKWNKQSDLALMAFLGVDHKFWFTGDDDRGHNDLRKNVSSIKDEHFSTAVDALQHLSTTFSPMEKLQVIHKTFQEINKEVQAALGDDYIWTMDDLFPVFQYVVVRARIRHLGSEVLMIEDLMESHLQHGELGIMFTTLKACYFQVKKEQSATN